MTFIVNASLAGYERNNRGWSAPATARSRSGAVAAPCKTPPADAPAHSPGLPPAL